MKRIRNKLAFCAMDGTSHRVSSMAEFMVHFAVLVAQEREFLVQVPGAPFDRRLLNGISKAEAQPKSQQKCLCTKWKCSILKFDQFSSFKSAPTDLSSAFS